MQGEAGIRAMWNVPTEKLPDDATPVLAALVNSNGIFLAAMKASYDPVQGWLLANGWQAPVTDTVIAWCELPPGVA